MAADSCDIVLDIERYHKRKKKKSMRVRYLIDRMDVRWRQYNTGMETKIPSMMRYVRYLQSSSNRYTRVTRYNIQHYHEWFPVFINGPERYKNMVANYHGIAGRIVSKASAPGADDLDISSQIYSPSCTGTTQLRLPRGMYPHNPLLLGRVRGG